MDNKTRLLQEIAEFSNERHHGQVDMCGNPHLLHVMRVALSLYPDLTEMSVALLHDVVEDTDTTVLEIAERFGYSIALSVDALTHRKGETNREYWDKVMSNKDALRVKLADVRDNITRKDKPEDEMEVARLRNKYEEAWLYLTGERWVD